MKRIALWTIAAVLIAFPIAMAQGQITQLTRGDGGVGRLVLGLGTGGAATVANARVTLTNAQVLALHNTSVQVIVAPGAGYFVDVIDGVIIFDYTAAYTAGAGDDLRLYYGSNSRNYSASNTIETTGLLTATADRIHGFSGTPDDTPDNQSNTAVHIFNSSAVAFGGGNAANEVDVDVTYVIRRTGL